MAKQQHQLQVLFSIVILYLASASALKAQSLTNYLRLRDLVAGNEVSLRVEANSAAYNLFFPSNTPSLGSVLLVNGLTGSNAKFSWVNPSAIVWGLNGNSGTNPATNFLGTTDNLALNLRTNNLQRMTITNMGYVGIGISDPRSRLEVLHQGNVFGSENVVNGHGMQISSGRTNADYTLYMGTDMTNAVSYLQSVKWGISVAPLVLNARGGKVGIGTAIPAKTLHVNSSEDVAIYVESNNNDNNGMIALNATSPYNWFNNWHEFISFQRQGNIIGYIANFGLNSVTYNTVSDYRLKYDRKDFNALDLIKKIKIYDYAWKSDSTRMFGVMAHELQQVIPYLVTGKKDEVDDAGKMVPQAVDYSKLSPVIVKALQEQQSTIEKLQLQIEKQQQQINQLQALLEKTNKK